MRVYSLRAKMLRFIYFSFETDSKIYISLNRFPPFSEY